MTRKLYIVPIAHPRQENLELLRRTLSEIFTIPAEFLSLKLNIDSVYNIRRNQYHATEILAMLLRKMPADADRIIGVTNLDLYIPILTFVFGEAQLKGRAAVVSCFRLRNEFYGLPANNDLLAERFAKEAVHELGHTFGLIHCENPTCVMHASTYAEEIDLKNYQFCPNCRAVVNSKIR
ncbi:peptidase family M54 [bacterium BMS3Abin05]|nr:peptidase family M54 [bacterium BMS3Abin05]GBE27713.1 peptidase family M54 [bacterium BMS3Bbin03]